MEGKKLKSGKINGFITLTLIVMSTIFLWILSSFVRIESGRIERYQTQKEFYKDQWELEDLLEFGKYELKKADDFINNEELKGVVDYFGGNPRIWISKSDKSFGNYKVKHIYKNKTSFVDKVVLSSGIRNEFEIRLLKKLKIGEENILFFVDIFLYYDSLNKDVNLPDIEGIKEMWVEYDENRNFIK